MILGQVLRLKCAIRYIICVRVPQFSLVSPNIRYLFSNILTPNCASVVLFFNIDFHRNLSHQNVQSSGRVWGHCFSRNCVYALIASSSAEAHLNYRCLLVNHAKIFGYTCTEIVEIWQVFNFKTIFE